MSDKEALIQTAILETLGILRADHPESCQNGTVVVENGRQYDENSGGVYITTHAYTYPVEGDVRGVGLKQTYLVRDSGIGDEERALGLGERAFTVDLQSHPPDGYLPIVIGMGYAFLDRIDHREARLKLGFDGEIEDFTQGVVIGRDRDTDRPTAAFADIRIRIPELPEIIDRIRAAKDFAVDILS